MVRIDIVAKEVSKSGIVDRFQSSVLIQPVRARDYLSTGLTVGSLRVLFVASRGIRRP